MALEAVLGLKLRTDEQTDVLLHLPEVLVAHDHRYTEPPGQ